MAKRKLRTWVKATLIGGAVSIGILGFSSISFSNSDWVNENITRSSKLFSEAGYSKVQDMKKREKDEVITENLDPFIQDQIELLEQEMENYYSLLLEGYSQDSEEVENVKKKIETLRQTILSRYKDEIKLLFPEQ